LAVFDRRCHRIGYGAGYYDRTISRLEKLGRLLTIGIAFSIQEVDQVPDEPHDRALDMIVTEREIITRSNH
jgi:5-formyltetrahydrofolate cyclo-ligase